MKRHKIIKDKKTGKLKRFEKWENGKKKKELKRGKNELPSQANWRAIERAREWNREGKKGKPPWAGGGNQGQGKGKKKGQE